MKVKDAMHKGVDWVSPDTPITEIAKLMRAHDIGCIPIGEDDKLVGMVTDRDIVIRAVADGSPGTKPVREIASGNVVCTQPGMSVRDAAKLMGEHQIRRLPVVENERLVGIVSLGYIAVKEGKDSRTGDTLENISEGVKKH